MKTELHRRPVSATILAIILGWLGVAGLLNAVAWPLVRNSELMRSAPPEFVARFPAALGSWWLAVLCLAYGISALIAAKTLWRLAPSATAAYAAWAVTVVIVFVALSISLPSIPITALVGFLVPVIGLLLVGGLVTRRFVQT